MKLTFHQEQFVKLIGRSPADADGWRKVSEPCCNLFTHPDWPNAIPEELFEFEKFEQGGRVRFTDRGAVLADYV